MPHCRICVILVAGGLLAGSAAAQVATTGPSARPATQPAAAELLMRKISSLMDMPRARSREELAAEINKRMPQVLEAVAEMEKSYGGSGQIHEARALGVVAATRLMRINNDLVMGQVAEGLAKRVLASSATPRQKLYADAHLVLLKIKPVGRASPTGAGPNGAGTQPVKAGPELVRRFVQRHGRGKLGAEAYGVAMQLAAELEDRALGEELKEVFVKEYPAHPDARRILREQGKGPDVGKPFKAELRKLDGSKLKLPEGLLGKVVVVDFWATWCGYCVAEIPRMKALHAKYEARGVEFVGVSLDSDPKAVDGFVRGQGMNWIHACSGLGWSDPTVRRYGIGGIPNIWVVGRDGKVVSDNARADLEATIRRALAAPATTTKPARK